MRELAVRILPAGLTLALMFMFQGAVALLPAGAVLPDIPALMAFFWTLYRPNALQSGWLFGIGLLQDALVGSPLGLHALGLMLLRAVLMWKCRPLAAKPFVLQWLTLALLLAALELLRLSLWHNLVGIPIQPMRGVMEWGIGVAGYPLLHWLGTLLYVGLPARGTR